MLEGIADSESGWRGRFDDTKEGSLKDALTRSILDHGYLFTDILSWLLPTLPLENRWADWVDPRVVRIETIDERPCWRVRGMRYGADLDLWFDCESYLVRRASLTRVTDTQELYTVQVAIDPRVDVDIPPGELPAWKSP